jgi:heme oxygenase
MGQDLSVEEYVACLRRLHGVVAAWEEYAAEHAPAWLSSVVGGRRRLGLLEDDLAWFGVRVGEDVLPSMPVMRGDGGFVGAMYVMEGSTLGGQLIARHLVRVLGLEDGHGNAYFRGHGERTGAMWKEFCQVVRTQVADEETDGAIEGAKAMFGIFGDWMRSAS